MLAWLKTYSHGALAKRASFPKPTESDIRRLADPATIAIAGDWGTGTDEAARIAKLMDGDRCDYTVHLGDVYYVGDDSSIKENCEGIPQQNGYIPVSWPRGKKGTLAMNGNHEAYARDGAYFKWIRKSFGQESSCFALYNDCWLLLGLDTGYNSEGIPWIGWVAEHFGWEMLMPSCKLPQESIDWLRTTVQPLLQGQRGVILLSHHQYFSSFDNEYRNAARQLATIEGLAERDVLWLWGHEHRLAAYDLFGMDGIKAHGRCIGHGGMPVDRGQPTKRSRPLKFYDDRSYDPKSKEIVKRDTNFGVNGYALLKFDGAKLTITYRDISGAEVVIEHWTSRTGNLISVAAPTFSPGVEVAADGKLSVASRQAEVVPALKGK